MLKMILDPMGGIVLTNDGNAILREVEVSHPAAKSMIELSRTQDEEVGDGTTSVIILGALLRAVVSLNRGLTIPPGCPAGEVLASALPSLNRNIHPITIISAYKKALNDALDIIDEISLKVDTENRESMIQLIRSTIGTKFISQWADLMCGLALDAVKTVALFGENGRKEVDVKRYVRIEKVCDGTKRQLDTTAKASMLDRCPAVRSKSRRFWTESWSTRT